MSVILIYAELPCVSILLCQDVKGLKLDISTTPNASEWNLIIPRSCFAEPLVLAWAPTMASVFHMASVSYESDADAVLLANLI